MRYGELFEKRRGGKLNPKVDIYGELKKYVDSGEHYISFVVMDKLGINPRSGYATPIGIYSYPVVSEVMKPILATKDLKRAPFMGDAPYVFLFKPKRIDRGLYLDEYRESYYTSDVEKLREFMASRDARFTDSAFDTVEAFAKRDAKIANASGWIWNLTRLLGRLLSGEDKLKTYTLGKVSYGDRVIITGGEYFDQIKDTLINGMGKLGKVGEVVDIYEDGYYGVRVKIGDDRYDEFDISIDDIELVPVIDSKYSDLLKNLSSNIGMGVNASNPKAVARKWKISDVDVRYGIIKLVGQDNGNELSISIDRFLRANPDYKQYVTESLLEYQKASKSANRSAVMWTHLLYRVLGYEFVDDSYGSGLIHANEPYQAVFFNRGVIDIIDRFDNPVSGDYGLNFSSIFNNTNTTEYVERIEPKVMDNILRSELKNVSINGSISSRIPSKFMGHVVVGSSKLQAALILNDFGMVDYIKKIHSDAIAIMDRVMLERIRNIQREDYGLAKRLDPILRYFRIFHSDGWELGDKTFIDHAISIGDGDMLLAYMRSINRARNSKIEAFVLDNPKYIGRYAKLIGSRWLAGERELLKLPPSGWVVKEYLDIFNIEYSDLGIIDNK